MAQSDTLAARQAEAWRLLQAEFRASAQDPERAGKWKHAFKVANPDTGETVKVATKGAVVWTDDAEHNTDAFLEHLAQQEGLKASVKRALSSALVVSSSIPCSTTGMLAVVKALLGVPVEAVRNGRLAPVK